MRLQLTPGYLTLLESGAKVEAALEAYASLEEKAEAQAAHETRLYGNAARGDPALPPTLLCDFDAQGVLEASQLLRSINNRLAVMDREQEIVDHHVEKLPEDFNAVDMIGRTSGNRPLSAGQAPVVDLSVVHGRSTAALRCSRARWKEATSTR